MRFIFILFSVSIVVSHLSHYVYAADPNYSIRHIDVDAVGSNATQAREEALAQGQEKAFRQVIARLAPSTDLDALAEFVPELSDEEKNTTIANMVRALDIQNESVTGRRYRATVDIHFQPEYIKEFLTRHEIIYGERTVSRIVILPVLFDSNDQIPTIDLGTAWARAWQNVIANKGSGTVDFRLLNANDVALSQLNVAQILAPDYQLSQDPMMRRLLQTYRASHVALAAVKQAQGHAGQVDVMARLLGASQALQFSEAIFAADLTEAFQQSAHILAARMSEQHTQLDVADFTDQDRIHVTIPVRQHHDWLAIQARLNELRFVTRWQLLAFNSRQADVVLWLTERHDEMVNLFAQAGFSLEQRNRQLFLYSHATHQGKSLFNILPSP